MCTASFEVANLVNHQRPLYLETDITDPYGFPICLNSGVITQNRNLECHLVVTCNDWVLFIIPSGVHFIITFQDLKEVIKLELLRSLTTMHFTDHVLVFIICLCDNSKVSLLLLCEHEGEFVNKSL